MRGAALLLLYCLVAPSIASIVCDLNCDRAERDETSAASVEGCHQNASASNRLAFTSGMKSLCHDDAGALAATVVERQLSKAPPSVLQAPGVVSVHGGQRSVFALSAAFSPPPVVLSTIPLRI